MIEMLQNLPDENKPLDSCTKIPGYFKILYTLPEFNIQASCLQYIEDQKKKKLNK